MTLGEPDAGKPPVRFDEGRSQTVIGLWPLNPSAPPTLRALVKLVTSWVKVPPVELDGSRSKRGIRDEAVKLNHKRDIVRNCRVATKVNLI